MGSVSRPGTETMRLAKCPVCNGIVNVGECGYTAFNPGWAKCDGKCGRKWELGYVDDQWAAGRVWNTRAAAIVKELEIIRFIKKCVSERPVSVSRDFKMAGLKGEAMKWLKSKEEKGIVFAN